MANYDTQYAEPIAVAEAVAHALGDVVPRRRYMVVPVEREAEVTIRKAIDELVQRNQWSAYRNDRAALIRMLDWSLVRHP